MHDIEMYFFYQQAASPACTELETIVLDWLGISDDSHPAIASHQLTYWRIFYLLLLILICAVNEGKAIGLPDDFLALKEGSRGGGVIQVCSKNTTNVSGFQPN